MKLNMKYCVIGLFLISIIIFSCLGNNLYEGLINENEVRENTYKSGTEHAKDQGEQYQNLIKNQGLLSDKNSNNSNNTNNDNRVSCIKSCINTCSNNTNKPKGLDCNVY